MLEFIRVINPHCAPKTQCSTSNLLAPKRSSCLSCIPVLRFPKKGAHGLVRGRFQ
jgi:hypothetical protein